MRELLAELRVHLLRRESTRLELSAIRVLNRHFLAADRNNFLRYDVSAEPRGPHLILKSITAPPTLAQPVVIPAGVFSALGRPVLTAQVAFIVLVSTIVVMIAARVDQLSFEIVGVQPLLLLRGDAPRCVHPSLATQAPIAGRGHASSQKRPRDHQR